MKKNLATAYCILACAILMFVFSCKKDLSVKKNPPNPTNRTVTTTDSNFVTLDEALIIAQQAPSTSSIASSMQTKQTDGTISGSARLVQDYIEYPNADAPSMYIINYQGGGFVIVPSDKRMQPILAFSSTGHFAITASMPFGLTNWLNLNHKNMQVLRSNTTITRRKAITSLWSQFKGVNLNGSGKGLDMAAPPPGHPTCQPSSSNHQVGPLLTTTWAQGVPYNQAPGIPAGTYSGGKCPTGCVATAIAQVMYFWKYPATYNWTIMPTTSNSFTSAGETEVSRLMYNVGAAVGMSYSSSGSSAYSSNTDDCLKSSGFHYASATYTSWNSTSSYMTVQSNINSGEPVILSGASGGEGHEWVCDGYLASTETYCSDTGGTGGSETYLYFDMNWGWNEQWSSGNVDGWFAFDAWNVYNGPTYETFNSSLGMTYNIHP